MTDPSPRIESTIAEDSPAMNMIIHMQQQQIEMQKQMTQLMAKILSPTATSVNTDIKASRTKIERPTVDTDCSDNKWVIFEDAWTRYKEMATISKPIDIRNELRSSCSSSVNEMLFNFIGPEALNNATEKQLLAYIKSVAVKSIHPEVYRQQFFTMSQSDGETTTCFIARLKAQAMLCAFTRQGSCRNTDCTASYSEDMIRSQLIAGIRNASHQNRVLSEMDSIKTLDQLTTRLLTLESTEKASYHFRPPHNHQQDITIAPIKSDYKARKYATNNPTRNSPQQMTKPIIRQSNRNSCTGCGRPHHVNGRRQCPAWNKTCNKCLKPNHFATVCQSSSNATIQIETSDTEEISYMSSISTETI
jgi:hypothetical protein